MIIITAEFISLTRSVNYKAELCSKMVDVSMFATGVRFGYS